MYYLPGIRGETEFFEKGLGFFKSSLYWRQEKFALRGEAIFYGLSTSLAHAMGGFEIFPSLHFFAGAFYQFRFSNVSPEFAVQWKNDHSFSIVSLSSSGEYFWEAGYTISSPVLLRVYAGGRKWFNEGRLFTGLELSIGKIQVFSSYDYLSQCSKLGAGVFLSKNAVFTVFAGFIGFRSFDRLTFQLSYSFPQGKVQNIEQPSGEKQERPKLPDFQTLVRWGVPPGEALQIVKSRNFCNLSSTTKSILKKHGYVCYE